MFHRFTLEETKLAVLGVLHSRGYTVTAEQLQVCDAGTGKAEEALGDFDGFVFEDQDPGVSLPYPSVASVVKAHYKHQAKVTKLPRKVRAALAELYAACANNGTTREVIDTWADSIGHMGFTVVSGLHTWAYGHLAKTSPERDWIIAAYNFLSTFKRDQPKAIVHEMFIK